MFRALHLQRSLRIAVVGGSTVVGGLAGSTFHREPALCETVQCDTKEEHKQKLLEKHGFSGPMKIGRLTDPEIDRVLLTEQQIARKVTELAGRMAADYNNIGCHRITLVSVLKGSFIFTADLMRALSHAGLECEVEFISVSSYGSGKTSSGTVRLELDTRHDVGGKHVLIVEDICDSGNTLLKLMDMFKSRDCASVKSVTLLSKSFNRSPAAEAAGLHVDYVGFEIPDYFVGGYGLDFAERFRELGEIVGLKPSK